LERYAALTSRKKPNQLLDVSAVKPQKAGFLQDDSRSFSARASYTGGTGNDLTLTVVP